MIIDAHRAQWRRDRAARQLKRSGLADPSWLLSLLELPHASHMDRCGYIMTAFQMRGREIELAKRMLEQLGYAPEAEPERCCVCRRPVIAGKRVRLHGRITCSPTCCTRDLRLRSAERKAKGT